MRKIIYLVHTSVDGFIEGQAGEFDWPVVGPELSACVEELAEAHTADGRVVVLRCLTA